VNWELFITDIDEPPTRLPWMDTFPSTNPEVETDKVELSVVNDATESDPLPYISPPT